MARQLGNVAGEKWRHKPQMIAKIERSISVREIAHVGSTYINSMQGNDIDIVARVSDSQEAWCNLKDDDWRDTGGGSGHEDDFNTYRKGDVNLMITESEEFITGFELAAEVCKALRLSEKWQRIAVHRVIMNEETAEVARERSKAPD
jgi:hypothetical protein